MEFIRELFHFLRIRKKLWLANPWPAQLKYKSTFNWPGYIENICKEVNCEKTINAFPEFERENHDVAYKKYFVPNDIHYNVAGNELIADIIIKEIE